MTGPRNPDTAVAIVGIGGVLPGARDLEEFWRNVRDGSTAVREVPPERWYLSTDEVRGERPGGADRVDSLRGCFIESFSPQLDGLAIDKALVDELDPLFAFALCAGKAALDDCHLDGVDRSRIGVVIGNIVLPTETASALARETLGRTLEETVLGEALPLDHRTHPLNRYPAGLPAGLLARALGIGGGAYTLDAACASSLYALQMAVRELQAGRADAMITGGVSRPDCLYTQMGFSQLRALSPTGVCSPFDLRGDGLVVGEGAGFFVLRRLDDALRAGDRVWALIRGIGLSNDVGGSLLAPESEGQLRALRAAYEQAGWRPSDVDLNECHATGTPRGDAVEFNSLRSLWQHEEWRNGQCVIGSVKSNIGHLLTAAGAAGLLKTLFAMRDRVLPPTANFRSPSPRVELSGSPFAVLTRERPWERRAPGKPLRAGVSAFGFGGINAHVLIEEWPDGETGSGALGKRDIDAVEISTGRPKRPEPPAIAIVGMAASFGKWTSLESFGRRVLGEVSNGAEADETSTPRSWGTLESRWLEADGVDARSLRGYPIDSLRIPLDRFRIPPKELAETLPQQLLMLLLAGDAVADAGAHAEHRPRTGVFVGIGLDLNTTDFHVRWSLIRKAREWAKRLCPTATDEEVRRWGDALRDAFGPALSANHTMGALGGIVASRVAREFKIGGPSLTVSSEETSGLRALETATRALQSHALDQAIVGAVDLTGDVRMLLGAHAGRPFSRSGQARPFSADADGTVFGEGGAALVVKRLEDARRDEDRVYAVVRGFGSASGGAPADVVPPAETYRLALERAYADAQVDPGAVDHVEAHGSGNPQEDAAELDALTSFYDRATRHATCTLGSVKAVIGHAGAASGLAGVVRACLALHRRVLPPMSSRAALPSDSPFLLPPSPRYWARDRHRGPRRAGVSGMSVDGNCVHVVLEEGCGESSSRGGRSFAEPLDDEADGLFLVPADAASSLGDSIDEVAQFARASSVSGGARLARAWRQRQRRDTAPPSAAFVARDRDELLSLIDGARRALRGDPPEASAFHGRQRFFLARPERARLSTTGKLAFVFPGSGNEVPGMGRRLSARWPEILERQDRENLFLRSQLLGDVVWDADEGKLLEADTRTLLMAQVAHGTVLADLLRQLGVAPQAAIGYSLGETTALFALRAWTARDEMLRRMVASPLFSTELAPPYDAARRLWQLPADEPIDWVAGIVDRGPDEVRKELAERKRIYLLIVNTGHECVVGGRRQEVLDLVEKLGANWIPLTRPSTVHCEIVDVVAGSYRNLHDLPTTPPAGVDYYSGAHGSRYELSDAAASDALLAQAVNSLDFRAVVRAAWDDGVRTFVEVGPCASTTRLIDQILEGRPHFAASAQRIGVDEVTAVLELLAALAVEGFPIEIDVLYPGERGDDGEKMLAESPALTVTPGGAPLRLPQAPARYPSPAAAAVPSGPESGEQGAGFAVAASPSLTSPSGSRSAASHVELGPLFQQTLATQLAVSSAHQRFLETWDKLAGTYAHALESRADNRVEEPRLEQRLEKGPGTPTSARHEVLEPTARSIALDRDQCLEFAIGSIANVLGAEFAPIDAHPTRVRLPDEPLMLVDRILTIEGEPRSLTTGRVVTEHDVLRGGWYLDANRLPTCIAVEAGQADLFLSGYLGIDFETRGLAMYRLLDAEVTFHGGLPQAGEVVRYDIRIERFFRQGSTWLFRFQFDSTVNGEPFLTMRKGCAGFFTSAELAAGTGILRKRLDLEPQPGKLPDDWRELAPFGPASFDRAALAALRRGEPAACFGSHFARLPLARPQRLPAGRLRLLDEISLLEPDRGRHGLGRIRGEADIRPGDWFLTCHFSDDQVMPGTLMYESCLHTLRVYLMRLGWIGEEDEVVCEPVAGVTSQLKCRGQVTETTQRVTYEVEIKELGYRPEPYAIADALMYADGKPIVEIRDMSVQLTGLTRERVEALWDTAAPQPVSRPVGTPLARRIVSASTTAQERPAPLFDRDRILAFATGKPSEAFGEPYRVFDEERIIARLPGPPYQFLDRITEIRAEPWKMVAGGDIVAEYDVPPDAWYFEANRQEEMPFAALLEIALQPCGWLAAYLGSALTSDSDLSFRNLGGNAVLHAPVTSRCGTLATHVKITRVSSSGGMIIQNYQFSVSSASGPVYSGDTYFGYFSKAALGQQVGLRDARLHEPDDAERAAATSLLFPSAAPFPDERLRMLDRIDALTLTGGPYGEGFVRGGKDVRADEWFFAAHFFQDPVWPGSLGLEAFLQLLKVFAASRWGAEDTSRLGFATIAPGQTHHWEYRGQVIPRDRHVTVEASIREVDDSKCQIRADGFLTVDGRIIYQMSDFCARLRT